MGRVLPRKAVHKDTWSKILTALGPAHCAESCRASLRVAVGGALAMAVTATIGWILQYFNSLLTGTTSLSTS
jgi:hypothetical protein